MFMMTNYKGLSVETFEAATLISFVNCCARNACLCCIANFASHMEPMDLTLERAISLFICRVSGDMLVLREVKHSPM